MNDVPILGQHDERRIFQECSALFDAPAYVRRARSVEEALEQLLARCRRQREEWLLMVRIRFRTLRGLAGDLGLLRPWLADDDQLAVLMQLQITLATKPGSLAKPTSSTRVLRRGIAELGESVERFNRRWANFVAELDLTYLNRLRADYNRYYLLEKECALRSPRLARQGFRPLEPATPETILEALPLLPMPRLRKG